MTALTTEMANLGHDKLAKQGTVLNLMTIALGNYQDHAKAISAALSIQKRGQLNSE
jgi:hypothetical protein